MGSDERDRRFFDPKVYRIVMFDQRGVGKSIPRAELKVVYNPGTQVISATVESILVFYEKMNVQDVFTCFFLRKNLKNIMHGHVKMYVMR